MRICRPALMALLILTILPFSPAWAQPQPSTAVHPLPSDAELDALWAGRKWNELGAALSNLDGASLPRSMNWLHSRLDAGGGLLLGLIYARDLWLIGKGLNVADSAKDMRVTAGMITLYTYEIIIIDGAKCQDGSAPGHRLEQLLSARRETLAYLKQLPQEWKTAVVNIALAFERKTANLRREDDLICRGGLEEYRVAMERGTQREVPTPAGHYGKTVDVRPPADWMPSFVAPAVYQPLQETARANMRPMLLRVIE